MSNNNTIGDPPTNIDAGLRRFLIQLKDAVSGMQGQKAPPSAPTLTVTPGPGSNLLQFTRVDADTYTIYWSTTPNFDKANSIDIGQTNIWTDDIGAAAVTRWYWVRGKINGVLGILSEAQSGTTLALNAVITPATAPSGSSNAAISQDIALAIDGTYRGGKYEPL